MPVLRVSYEIMFNDNTIKSIVIFEMPEEEDFMLQYLIHMKSHFSILCCLLFRLYECRGNCYCDGYIRKCARKELPPDEAVCAGNLAIF